MNILASTVLMIRPCAFGFNEDAFETNKFQQKPEDLSRQQVQTSALKEFNDFVKLLKEHQIDVLVVDDTQTPHTPDSIFPNNWISTHQNGLVVTYPMQPKNRRQERRKDLIEALQQQFRYRELLSLEYFENDMSPAFLEGTGSIVFDHQSKVAYAALSPRTDAAILQILGDHLQYKVVTFKAYGSQRELIYHTNVMLCIGVDFAIIGADTIDEADRERVLTSLRKSNKELILLNNDQVYHHFAGNMLQLSNPSGEKLLVMSASARQCLTTNQLGQILKYNDKIIAPELTTIESVGGGSARCMLAEIYEPL